VEWRRQLAAVKSSFTTLMPSQGQALTHPTQKSSTLKFNHFSDFENGYFKQNITVTRKLHFEHKTTEGLPQYLRPIVLERHPF
jgi:hypothetical protein